MLIKADPYLECDVADVKFNPPACHQLTEFLEKFLPQWLHCAAKKAGWQAAGDIIHDNGS